MQHAKYIFFAFRKYTLDRYILITTMMRSKDECVRNRKIWLTWVTEKIENLKYIWGIIRAIQRCHLCVAGFVQVAQWEGRKRRIRGRRELMKEGERQWSRGRRHKEGREIMKKGTRNEEGRWKRRNEERMRNLMKKLKTRNHEWDKDVMKKLDMKYKMLHD